VSPIPERGPGQAFDMNYLYAFLIGLFTANGLPHFIKGITGEPFRTPFKRPSPPVVNVLWAFFNWVVAFFFLSLLANTHPTATLLATIGAGALVMALNLSLIFSRRKQS